jgi:hypothetical protein
MVNSLESLHRSLVADGNPRILPEICKFASKNQKLAVKFPAAGNWQPPKKLNIRCSIGRFSGSSIGYG